MYDMCLSPPCGEYVYHNIDDSLYTKGFASEFSENILSKRLTIQNIIIMYRYY